MIFGWGVGDHLFNTIFRDDAYPKKQVLALDTTRFSLHVGGMLIRATGPVDEGLVLITLGQSCFCLAGSPEAYTLIDCGTTAHLQGLEARLIELGIKATSIKQILLTNGSGPRAGAVFALASKLPHAQILLSSPIREILAQDAELAAEDKRLSSLFKDGASIVASQPVVEHEKILKRVEIMPETGVFALANSSPAQVFAAPGYTTTSLAYFLPGNAALITDQGLGYYRARSPVAPGANAGIDLALSTIAKLCNIPAKFLMLPYLGTLSGALVKRFFKEGRETLETLRAETSRAKAEGISDEDCISQISDFYYRPESSDPLLCELLEQSRKKLLIQLGLHAE